jgi:mono/diheme cytochrome c family protein
VNALLFSAFAAFGGYAVTAVQAQSAPPPVTVAEQWGAWCARCHADDGSGQVNEPTITVEPMDFTDCKIASAETDADWERAIAKGGLGVGLSSQMPAFEDSLSGEQIRAFVSHMRTFCNEPGWPSGNSNFPRPILTEKAFPENEFLILPAVSHWNEDPAPSITEATLVALYERRIGRRSMIEIEVPMVGSNALTAWTSGIGDVAVAFKHAVFATAGDPRKGSPPRIVSLGLEVVLPSGDRFKTHGSGTTTFEPFVSAGMMLHRWYVQGELRVELPVDRLRADRALVYRTYVGRDTSLAPNAWTIGVELTGVGHYRLLGVTTNVVALTPQVRKGLTGTGALAAAAGVTLPINKRDAQGVKWVGYLLWEYLEPWRARR